MTSRFRAALGLVGLVGLVVPAFAGSGDEISHSRGRPGGVVVLWPRVVPETDDAEVAALAARLQTRLQAAAIASVPAAKIDVRPQPERVCPRSGCRAVSVGLMLGHQDGGCAALAVVGPAGPEAQRLVPLAGKFQMSDASLLYRAAPEGKVVVSEFVPCAELEASLDNDALSRLLQTTASPAPAPPAPAPPAPAPAPAPPAP